MVHDLDGLSRARRPKQPVPQKGAATEPGTRPRLIGPQDAAHILELQRAAGNQAVTEALTQHQLQRYEAGEHVAFGDVDGKPRQTSVVNGVVLTYGQMIAMGDFFQTPEEMRKAPPKVLERLAELIEKDRANPGKAVSTEDWQDATKDLGPGHRYLDLAAKNEAHFGPAATGSPTEAPVDHYGAWKTYHFQALDEARAGNKDKAMETNAFADHFLTDAFAAGHLINKREVMGKAEASLESLKKKGRYYMRTSIFTDRVAAAVMADAKAEKLKDYEINVGRKFNDWQPVTAPNLSQIVAAISWKREDEFFSIFARVVHNRLNWDIKHRYGGVMVENNVGNRWALSGDETLKYSEDTLEIGRRAVAQSQANVTSAAGAQDASFDYEAMAKKVWDFTPHPTAAGKKKIDAFTATLTDAGQAETATEFAGVVLANFETLIDQLVNEEHRLRKIPKPEEKPVYTPDAGIPEEEVPSPQ